MERSAFRFGMVVITFVLLFPSSSMAGGPLATGSIRPIELETPWHRGEEALARILALVREVFRDRTEGETCSADRCAKGDSENRAGIDPNGNS